MSTTNTKVALISALEHVALLADDANFSEACAHLPELESAMQSVKAALANLNAKP